VRADLGSASGMPLVQSLMRNASSGRVSFHMPGHSDARGFPAWFTEAALGLDTTELPETDDLNHPTGPAREAMALAAQAFDAGWTRFVTCGATCGLLAMVASSCPRGSTVLIQRTCHRSVVSAVSLLDLRPAFLPGPEPVPAFSTSERAFLAPLPPASPVAVAAALARDPSIRAVLVTSPDYYGTASDLAPIAEAAHAHGALLLVDEAHGAHFAFAPGLLPPSAMASGADLCVQSAHKTLPALTQAALLHVSRSALAAGRVDPDLVEEALRTFQTSSPSFLLAASLDLARAQMQRHGRDRIEARLMAVLRTFDRIRAMPGLPFLPIDAGSGAMRDPLRIVIHTGRSGLTGFETARRLRASGVSAEMADPARVVLLPGLFGDDDGLDLYSLERALIEAQAAGPARDPAWTLAPEVFGTLLSTPCEAVLPPSIRFDAGARESVPLRQAVGRLLAGPLVPYPPGIPLIWPGERLDAGRAALVEELAAAGGTVSGLSAGGVRCVAEGPMV
jgi:arginine/lysine/ornithine decarboxylase